jgi:hypothetical protein
MTEDNSFTHKTIISHLKESSKAKYGLISINYVLINCRMEDLLTFIKNYGISLPDESVLTRFEYIILIAMHLTKMYYISDIQKKYENPLEYIGHAILKEGLFTRYLINLDFIVKQDLIDIFADLYADLGITMRNIEKTSSVSNGSVFVTTPVGVLKIGLNKLKYDMIKLNCRLFVVDPSRKIIFGISKTKKYEIKDDELRETFVRKLPRTPIRAPSQIFELSDYYFNESNSYDPIDFRLFDIYDDLEHNKLLLKEEKIPKYAEIFRNLIIMEVTSGTPIISYESDNFKELTLASGFLAAMDSFVAQIGGSKLEEINYKGFYVQAAYGKFTKLACFLSIPADKSLKERLKHLIGLFEEKYEDNINKFRLSGDTNLFDRSEIFYLIKEIIDV